MLFTPLAGHGVRNVFKLPWLERLSLPPAAGSLSEVARKRLECRLPALGLAYSPRYPASCGSEVSEGPLGDLLYRGFLGFAVGVDGWHWAWPAAIAATLPAATAKCVHTTHAFPQLLTAACGACRRWDRPAVLATLPSSAARCLLCTVISRRIAFLLRIHVDFSCMRIASLTLCTLRPFSPFCSTFWWLPALTRCWPCTPPAAPSGSSPC